MLVLGAGFARASRRAKDQAWCYVAAVRADRRSVLKKGLLGGFILAVGGALPIALRRGAAPRAARHPLQVLTPMEHEIFASAAARLVPGEGAGPGAAGWPSADALDCAGKVDALLARLYPSVAAELRRLLRVFESAMTGLVVLAGGALNTPALLLRSKLGNGNGRVGRRTFLHPTVPLLAFYDEPIEGFSGPPQSVACHHFADRGERVGYFMETSPVHPMLSAVAFPGFGAAHGRTIERLAHAQATIALLIDGHHGDQGGSVASDLDGRLRVSYPLDPALREAAVDAIKSMARLQLAAGAREVVTLHEDPLTLRSESDFARVDDAPFGPNLHALFSAHQMGGCAMGEDPATSVVDSRGRHHEIENLWITDGSVFPTSLGVNPQLSVYALARHFATGITSAPSAK